MISPTLRIRLEGRVEALEAEVVQLERALTAARRRDFGLAVDALIQGRAVLSGYGDAGIQVLLNRHALLRTKVRAAVVSRLRSLGIPTDNPLLGSTWLIHEPVLYEHHRITFAFLFRAFHTAAFCIVPLTAIATVFKAPLCGFTVGLALFFTSLCTFGWSDVVVTERRLVLEGTVFPLDGLWRIALVRPFMQMLPMSFRVELHYRGLAQARVAKVFHASRKLRETFQELGIETGHDWGPW